MSTLRPVSAYCFSGYAGGSHYSLSGGAAEFCLPRDPQMGINFDGHEGYIAYVYGAEYPTETLRDSRKRLYDNNVPCAVCLSHGGAVVKMISARKSCFKSWNFEYNSYIMAGYQGHSSDTEYVCEDNLPEALQGGNHNHDGKLLYKVEVRCCSLKCPPYVSGQELLCVVCTR